MRRSVTFAAAVVLAVFISGCTYTTTTNPTTTTTPTDTSGVTPTAQSGTASASIQGMAFSPTELRVTVGTKVTWTNNDSVSHTVTSDNGAFDSGTLSQGQSFSFTFNTAGTFSYHCSIHPSMTASVIVQ